MDQRLTRVALLNQEAPRSPRPIRFPRQVGVVFGPCSRGPPASVADTSEEAGLELIGTTWCSSGCIHDPESHALDGLVDVPTTPDGRYRQDKKGEDI